MWNDEFENQDASPNLQGGATLVLPATTGGPPGPAPTIALEAVEVTQVIQDLAMAVPLVAAKGTLVRLFLGTSSGPIVLRGTLRITSVANPATTQLLSPIADLEVHPGYNGQVPIKRQDLSKSLNFLWPIALCSAGVWTIGLETLDRIDDPQTLALPVATYPKVPFINSPPLRVHTVGIRYNDGHPSNTFEPAPLDFDLMRSWLGRTYPAAQVVWSQLTVDFPKSWTFAATDVNAYLRALCATDVAGGTDARTHYYGMVADDGGTKFMRGLASAIPTSADPSAVASGPTGVPRGSFAWDTDGSYGDWYAGHEIGHTFGREHANFCGAAGGVVPYPYANGQLDDNDTRFVGFDMGDATHAIPMKALPATVWHDIMTYCQYEWLSDFTYAGIRDRLMLENVLPATPPAPPGSTPGGGTTSTVPSTLTAVPGGGPGLMIPIGSIHVVATVSLSRDIAEFQYVSPLPGAAMPVNADGQTLGAAAGLKLMSLDRLGNVLWASDAVFIPDTCLDAKGEQTGTVDMMAPNIDKIQRFSLLRGEKELAHFEVSETPQPVRDIHSLTAAAGSDPNRIARPSNPVLAWTDDVRDEIARMGAPPAAAPIYTVQVSVDNRRSWRTIGLGLNQPHVTIDRNLIRDADNVVVRVISTDGVHSAVREQTFKALDL